MDSFHVVAQETSLLETSHFVEELQHSVEEHDGMFPVLVGESEIAYFHDVDGGYSPERNAHVINFIHRVQGPDSPANKTQADSYEAHLADRYFHITADDSFEMGDYPDENFVLSIEASDCMIGPHTFSEALTADVDKREGEYSPNYERQ